MPREFAPVNLEIWADPDFRSLPPAAQHLYLTLWTSPSLSYCGVHDWRPGRLAALSAGFTGEHIQTVADCLTARHFLVIDHATEEALIRSWARFDGLMKQPRMAVSYITAYASVASATLRAVLVRETQKIKEKRPELTCWTDPRVAEVLDHPSISAKDLATPEDPFAGHFGDGFALGLPQTPPRVSPGVSPPPTPAPTPAPNSITTLGADKSAAPKRATSLPRDWRPSEKHQELAAELRVNLAHEAEKFKDHALANGKTFKDWDAGFRTWLRNAVKFGGQQPSAPTRVLRDARDIEQPPDGLSEAEYAAWVQQQRARRRA